MHATGVEMAMKTVILYTNLYDEVDIMHTE